jgi:molecular chaperone GrpE
MGAEEHAAGVTEQSDRGATPSGEDEELSEPGEGTVEAAQEVAVELDELAATAAQRDEYLALAQRTQADFENYRKRVARDAAAGELRGVVRLARELLPALDNLDRALEHAGDGDTDQVLIDGLRLVQRELLGALSRAGIEAYGEAGERFDPGLHEAVAQQPYEGREAGEIAEIYQHGYRLDGTLIRPARVLVAG